MTPAVDGGRDLVIESAKGPIRARLHEAPGAQSGIVWVFGAGGGLGGPAGGVYERLGANFHTEGISSLQVAYRHPAVLAPCIADTLAGVAFLYGMGTARVALVGHSFGGAVVINAGAASTSVVGVAALSSQSMGAESVSKLAPRPLLLIHGQDDEVLPAGCSRDLYRLARRPKRMILYPGCGHGLDQCRKALDRDLAFWLRETLLGAGAKS